MAAESTETKVLDGKFQMISELGRGRLGKLFKARLLTSDKLVAVRVIDADLLEDRDKTLKLVSEVVAARALHHRDICTIRGFHMGGPRPYLVLEHVEGRTLDGHLERLPGGRCGLDEFRPMAASLLRALGYAHTKGVAHGNLHAGNIMVRPDGEICLLDCGLARPGAPNRPETTAPELATRPAATPQGDMFAAGAVFYRMLTGVWPRTEAPFKPVVGVEPGLNRALEACLDADPAARPTPAQVLHALDGSADAAGRLDTGGLAAAVPAGTGATHRKADERGPSKPAYQLPFSIAATLLLVLSLAVVAKRGGESVTETLLSAAPRTAPAETLDATLDSPRALPVAGDVWTSPELSSEFAYIPAGSAILGSPPDEAGRDADERLHPVEISRGFWMGRHEVTQREWESVMGTRPWEDKQESRPDLPATWVSWDQVNEFIHRLNRSADGETYRLPSEAEWEYAVRAGDAPETDRELQRTAWHRDNSDGSLQPVGLLDANPWGLRDTRGNAWEWVHDWYSDYPNDLKIDPQGPTSGRQRVVRGCSFFNPASICRVANRHKVDSRSGDRHIGFRLVRESR